GGDVVDHYFPAGSPFYEDVSDAALRDESADMMAWLQSEGGWGTGAMHIDFGIVVVSADDSAPMREFSPTSNHYSPDCDMEPVPLPPGGAIEGYDDYACEEGGDCHLIVVSEERGKLYEMWKADVRGAEFDGGCLAVW